MIPEAFHATFQRLIDGARQFVLVTHINPDGDALGSQFGLGAFLLERGARVRIVDQDPVPAALRFIAQPALEVEVYDAARHDAALAATELVVLVDNSAPDRLGRMEPVMRRLAGRTLCIDHHPARDVPWAHALIDAGSCATTAMIYELTRRCGWRPSAAAAEALYVGLATDTGFFRFNSTSADAHEIAAALLRLGVEPARSFREIYERNSAAFTRLLGLGLARLRMDAGGAVASVQLDRALIEAAQAQDVDPSEITTPLLAIDGVLVAALFRELPDGRIKVSLRSKGELDVHGLAAEFGGGGHRNASGIVVEGRLEAVAAQVTARATALLAARR
ncbi:MAG TPA: bifunctional oligoribonuclease/PAP phosphatase NrnA [Candidatus Polarisedimenticolaceae bacterium]|nr:bifunctional oligoribonuclease/PAP phosphatase NrnA [Candidatus Polarisedimenticolaceae bacterium]